MVKRRRDSLDIEEVEQLPPRVRRVIKYQESDDDASLESDDLGASDLDQQMESDEVNEHVVNGDLSETDKNGSLLVTLPIGRDKAREIEVVDGQGSHPHSQAEEEGSEKEGSDNDNDREENIIQAQLKQEMKEAQEDKDNHDIIPRSRVGRKSVVNDEDEYVEDEEDSNEEDSPDHSSDSDVHSFDYDSGFVVDSDDNKIKRPRRSQRRGRRKLLQGTRSSSRRKNTRSRRTIASESDYSGSSDSNGNEGDDDQLNLQQELEELRDSDSADIPRRKHLRARKEINYQILPPPTNDDPMETMAVETPSHPRGGGRRGGTNGMIRRLFPTTGPFGGNDVISIFGTPAGHGMAGGVGTVDSDSSDEENAGSKFKSGPIGARKKPELADTDPLGVDMNIDFSAVGGLDNYINQLKEMVTLPLRYPEVYQRFGVTPPRGVLFHGPPGTGKTLMARALAASASSEGKKITFFMRKGADCLSKWVGEAERQLRILFEEAKNQQPSIIFFDEIDGLAPVRSSKQEQIHASIVSTLLALMDGMDNRGQVIVIGATNRPDSVDSALRRPGRFDREFYFPLPDLEARKKIISIHTKKWNPPVEPNFINHIAQLTKGYGGADLRALCTEAALNAIQRRYPQIYTSNKKLLIDASLIDVAPVDFLKSYEKIIPSSARSTSSGAVPLPTRIEPLLGKTFENISKKLDHILPRQKKLTALEEAMFENNDLSFSHQERVRGGL